MEKLKKGDFIIIRFERKHAAAKVVAHVPEKKRLNVFTQGTLKWIDDMDFVAFGEKGAILKKGVFITKTAKPAPKYQPGTDSVTTGTELAPTTIPGPSVVIPLNEMDEVFLAPFRKGGGASGKTLTVEQVSDLVGKTTPATKHAIERLANLGYLDLMNADLQEYALSIRGLKHVPGTAKPKSEITKLKTDKSGEVVLTKKNRVMTLLKNPDMTVQMIAKETGAAESYIRGIRERNGKKMTEPEVGTIKRAVYDALRQGFSLTDVSMSCRVTISYAYQVRQQMLSAKIL